MKIKYFSLYLHAWKFGPSVKNSIQLRKPVSASTKQRLLSIAQVRFQTVKSSEKIPLCCSQCIRWSKNGCAVVNGRWISEDLDGLTRVLTLAPVGLCC